jgi:chromatin remodeling complex protein RSC6
MLLPVSFREPLGQKRRPPALWIAFLASTGQMKAWLKHRKKQKNTERSVHETGHAGRKLAKVVGDKPLPRTELTKKLWAYIRKNGLQDAKKEDPHQRR